MHDGSTASALPSAQTYARIYEEQQPRLVAYARSLTRNSWTAEDLVAEAHFRVWRRLAEGHEIDNVPAYLMTTVRHLATAAAGTAVRETPRDPHSDERVVVPAQVQRAADGDPAEQVSAVDLLVRVLGQLPERWVKALWLAEAEGQPLAAIGPQVGTKEGATAVLLHRAREGMRQAYLRVQAGAPDDPACQVHWARMPAYVRGAATERQSERLLGHVDTCDDCRARLAALMSANDRLPALVGPALLVFVAGGTGKYLLAGASVGTASGGLLEGVRHVGVGGSKAAVAAGAVVAGAVVVILALGPGYSTPTPAERTPVAEAPGVRVPVEEGPVEEEPVAQAPVSGGGGGGGTTVQAASAQRDGGSSVATRPQGGDESTPAVSEPADDSAPPPADPAPQEPEPPTEDTPDAPEAPVSPPAQDTPEDPTPPTEDAPPTAAPSTPTPDPAPEDPKPNPDPAPESPTPADPTPVENPAPTDPPAPADPAPEPTVPDPTTPEPTVPEPTTPDPTTPGDNCPTPEGPVSPVQD